MLRISVVINDKYLSFGVRIHISKCLVYFDIGLGKKTLIIWLKDDNSIISGCTRYIS